MKRILLTILSVMAFAGMSVAQDIYTSGYYTNNNGNRVAAVYKNGSKLYEFGGYSSWKYESRDLECYNGNVYWIWNATDASSDQITRGVIKKNNNSTNFLDEGADNLYTFQAMDIDYDGWTAAAGWKLDADNSNLERAAVWLCGSSGNTSATAHYLGNTSYKSYAYDVVWYNDIEYSEKLYPHEVFN